MNNSHRPYEIGDFVFYNGTFSNPTGGNLHARIKEINGINVILELINPRKEIRVTTDELCPIFLDKQHLKSLGFFLEYPANKEYNIFIKDSIVIYQFGGGLYLSIGVFDEKNIQKLPFFDNINEFLIYYSEKIELFNDSDKEEIISITFENHILGIR